jgi:hypothetical protein
MIKTMINFKNAKEPFPVGSWGDAEWHFIGYKYALEGTLPQPIEDDFSDFMEWQEIYSEAFFNGIKAGKA